MAIPERCDVVVIGGGPAGSTAATMLAQKGYDVVLFDRERHPRYRVGESLIPHTWKYMDMIGASDKLKAEGFVQKSGGTVIWNGVIRQMAFKDFGYSNPALHVERDRYDLILLEHARERGVRIFEEVVVQGADLRAEGEPVAVTYRASDDRAAGRTTARFVVDASGHNAVLARQLGARFVDEGFRFMSVWGYFEGSKYLSQGGQVHPFEDLKTFPPTTFVSSLDTLGDWGWMWHIPLRESTSVGLVVPQDHLRAVRGTKALEEFFLQTCYRIPYLDHLLEHARYLEGSLHVIRDYSYRTTSVAGPGYFLIGDAAAFVDPIFSVGVVLGMYSASIATWAIDRSFKQPDSTERNRALFSSQFLGRLELSRSLALPRYSFGGSATAEAKDAVLFESDLEQELMYVVSTVTTRNENVLELIERKDGRKIASDRYRTLTEISDGD
jgi:flavin-dependent dehydrogenase